jgi:hypothetical protein
MITSINYCEYWYSKVARKPTSCSVLTSLGLNWPVRPILSLMHATLSYLPYRPAPEAVHNPETIHVSVTGCAKSVELVFAVCSSYLCNVGDLFSGSSSYLLAPEAVHNPETVHVSVTGCAKSVELVFAVCSSYLCSVGELFSDCHPALCKSCSSFCAYIRIREKRMCLGILILDFSGGSFSTVLW